MVDFRKLRQRAGTTKVIDPLEVFRRLPKAAGINDLYTSQGEVLQAWFKMRMQRDVVVKLHTGGGKTLVGLLMGQSTLNETREPVLYLTPTVQLVKQALQRAKASGITAVPYERGRPLDDQFVNANAIMVATYKALFNGQSKFGLRGGSSPQNVGAIILDDAHSAFSVVRDSFTLAIESSKNRERYESLAGLFRKAFKDIDRLGTFDDVLSGAEHAVLEVPYWAWHEQMEAVRQQLLSDAHHYDLVWPLIRDRLHLCHALISRTALTVTPILPLLDSFPTFTDAARRIYMSATIADDSEIVRTFAADSTLARAALTSRSVAGVSERMILIPDLMPFKLDAQGALKKLLPWVSKMNLGSVVLVPSDKTAEQWADVATVARGSDQVEKLVEQLQARTISGPVVFANRYDGIDLPADSCRLLVMYGLPRGTGDYDMFRASALYGGATITRMLAQRIEQGIGRGARGAGDYCVVVLGGADLTAWIAKDANFRLLTSSTRAQLDMGVEVSKAVANSKDLARTIKRSFDRDEEWTGYHAETLAELLDDVPHASQLDLATCERRVLRLWSDGYHSKAIATVEQFVAAQEGRDPQTLGWMQQLGARIADHWGHPERAEDLQRAAFGNNRNLLRPKSLPPYRPRPLPGSQEQALARQIGDYRQRRGFLRAFEEDVVAHLHANATANQFESALQSLGTMIGLVADRFDSHGEGPDVLWLLPGRVGFVIEAKSRKMGKNALTKPQHGQLLVAAEWFARNYPDYSCVRVCVQPRNRATKAAAAATSYALTYERLASLISDAKAVLVKLSESQLPQAELVVECGRQLAGSSIRADRLAEAYLLPFEESE